MNKFFVIILFSIVFINTACKEDFNKVKSKEAKSKVIIINKEFNFGKISVNDTVRYTFLIKNVSNEPYVIAKIGTSCGCTNTDFTKTKVLKEDLARIEVVYVPSIDDSGFITKSIVVSDNSENAFHTFYIKGNIVN